MALLGKGPGSNLIFDENRVHLEKTKTLPVWGGAAGGVCLAIFCGKDRFDRFGTWPSNQRYNRFGLPYTASWDEGIVEAAMITPAEGLYSNSKPSSEAFCLVLS